MDTYPYDTDGDFHEFSWVFFNAGGQAMTIEAADALARHAFDNLGCGTPGTAHAPTVKYDALGSSGAPWEPGEWIPVEDNRMAVVATAPPRDVRAMSDAERAELRAALDAADTAEKAGA